METRQLTATGTIASQTTKFFNGLGQIKKEEARWAEATCGVRDTSFINASGNTYQVGYDGNENIDTVVNVSTGKLAAMYEYDPFGQTIKLTGEYARQNLFRFANHYADAESDLVYYGLRYYNANTGRWLNRDPIEERGGVNLYAMVANNPVTQIDELGLQAKRGSRKAHAKAQGVICCLASF